jgi:hypothetical protein
MITSSKLILTGVTSFLGVALAAGGLFLGTGVLTAADDPGQVLQVSGVGPVSVTSGSSARPQDTATPPAVPSAAPRTTVGQVAPPAAQTLPSYRAVTPSPRAPAQPAAPQPAPQGREPVHSSPGIYMEGR